ncbi:MAG: glycosyltransferase [Muribaculaceae bacterium]|nr:glycosyltransferase [Muribaculaceae bacterium]
MERREEVRLEVQVAVYGPDGMKRYLASRHPQVEGVKWLVSWQQPDSSEPVPGELLQREDTEVIVFADRGVSRNRNHGLDHGGTSDYILIGDDDVDYSAESLVQIIRAFDERPDIGILCLRYTCFGRYVKPYGEGEFDICDSPFGWYPTSFEMALRRSMLREVRFNENLSIGSPKLICGEEDVLLHDLKRRKVKGRGLPIVVGEHNHETTSERLAADPQYVFTHGAVTTLLCPWTWPLRMLLHAYRSPMPYFRYIRHTLAGSLYAYRTRPFRPTYINK